MNEKFSKEAGGAAIGEALSVPDAVFIAKTGRAEKVIRNSQEAGGSVLSKVLRSRGEQHPSKEQREV